MRKYLKKSWAYIVLCVVFSFAVAYGLSDFIDFYKGVCLLLPMVSIGLYIVEEKYNNTNESEQLVQSLDQIIGEQSQVIDEYEKIFETQLVHLPCVCGGNTFEGLFSPNVENIVECEKCKNKYRVGINYDTVLISEPIDLNKSFDDLVMEND
jgi:uncharacterized membrane protein